MTEPLTLKIIRAKTRSKKHPYIYRIHATTGDTNEFTHAESLRPLHEWYMQQFSGVEHLDWLPCLGHRQAHLLDFSPKRKTPKRYSIQDHYEWTVLLDGPHAEDALLQFMLRWDCEKVGFDA